MKAITRFIGIFRDSPTFGRDRANLISGFTIGITGLLLNGVVLMFIAPLMLDPNDSDFRAINENIEFGQILALILLGGATIFATLLIPLRLATLFWGPRLGRYFDQIVLSGISPFRFVIGKVTSQNMFLGLILFLLLPYFVLSLTLGGVELGYFAAGLFLLWLYCMALAVVMLWVSLYLNELLAAMLVIAGAGILVIVGCIPLPFQPFVMTPAPALLHPLFAEIPGLAGRMSSSYSSIFVSCAATMAAIICVALFAINLGPLFGIIRENSTFGEVVRAGDGKRKRWFRLRLHIQRPSEIAFFYENRSDTFRRHEGLIRWGIGLVGLITLLAVAHATSIDIWSKWLTPAMTRSWWIYEFHATYLTIHGCCLLLGLLLFSHTQSTTYLRIPFFRGRQVEVSRLDTASFLLLAIVSTTASIAIPFYFEQAFAQTNGTTLFPHLMYGTSGREVNYARVAIEGSLALTLAGFVVYALQRYVCLMMWLRSGAFFIVYILYGTIICAVPIIFAAIFDEFPGLRNLTALRDLTFTFSLASPFMVMMYLFNELGSSFTVGLSTVPFYVTHALLLGLLFSAIRMRGRKVRGLYLAPRTRKPG